MTSFTLERMLRENPDRSERFVNYMNDLAKREGYTINWERETAYASEVRCGWREELSRSLSEKRNRCK